MEVRFKSKIILSSYWKYPINKKCFFRLMEISFTIPNQGQMVMFVLWNLTFNGRKYSFLPGSTWAKYFPQFQWSQQSVYGRPCGLYVVRVSQIRYVTWRTEKVGVIHNSVSVNQHCYFVVTLIVQYSNAYVNTGVNLMWTVFSWDWPIGGGYCGQ